MLESEIFNIEETAIEEDMLSGDGSKHMLLIARKDDLEGAGGLPLLTKIIKAIQYDIDTDCLLLSLPARATMYNVASLIEEQQISDVVTFGVNPKDLGMNIHAKLYQPMIFEQYRFLLSHKVTEMDGNRDFKMRLWKCLQQFYL